MLKDLKYIFKLMGKHKFGYFTLLPLWSIVGSLIDVKVKDKSTVIETEKNVHFRIEGLDLMIEKGKTLALVSDSGGGKSTLGNLYWDSIR